MSGGPDNESKSRWRNRALLVERQFALDKKMPDELVTRATIQRLCDYIKCLTVDVAEEGDGLRHWEQL